MQPVQLAGCAAISAILLNCFPKAAVAEAVAAEVAAANAGEELPADATLVHQVINTLSQIAQFRFQVHLQTACSMMLAACFLCPNAAVAVSFEMTQVI